MPPRALARPWRAYPFTWRRSISTARSATWLFNPSGGAKLPKPCSAKLSALCLQALTALRESKRRRESRFSGNPRRGVIKVRTTMAKVDLFIALLFLSPTPSAAQGGQDTGALKGMVQDPAGALVHGAKVKLVRVAGHQRVETTSDEKGRFAFTGQPMGDYILSVAVQGFKLAEVRVTISASPAWVRVRLVVEEVNEEVTVRAQTYSSVSTQANADVIKLDEHLAENLPAMNGDPLTVASLFVDPAVAGTGGPEILVDGVPTDVVDLPISSIRAVEVNK